MADDRVEASLALRGLQMTDAESIEALQRRQVEFEKINRGKPVEAFSSILAKKQKISKGAASETPKQRAYRQLPKSGPKPKVLHPTLNEVFGREDEDVVLKG